MQKDYEIYIKDILTSILKIKQYTKTVSYRKFCDNEMMNEAVIRNFEIIGEAVKKIPFEIRRLYPDIPWVEIAGLRDVVIHDYRNVNFKIIWAIIEEDLDLFKEKLEVLLKKS